MASLSHSPRPASPSRPSPENSQPPPTPFPPAPPAPKNRSRSRAEARKLPTMAAYQKQGKMIGYINYRMRATLKDGRQIVGQMLAFDKHMNLVLSEAEEFRMVKRKAKQSGPPGAQTGGQLVQQEEKRGLGLVILRGAHVVCCSVDGPPPADPSQRVGQSLPGGGPAASAAVQAGPGIARPAGRGAGLQGPAAGIGGAGFGGPAFPGAPPPFAGRGGPPPGFPPAGFGPPGGFPPPGFQPPPGGRGFGPPGGYGGR